MASSTAPSRFCVGPLPLALSLSCPPGESHPLAPPLLVLCLFHCNLSPLRQPSSFVPLSVLPSRSSSFTASSTCFLFSYVHHLPFSSRFTLSPVLSPTAPSSAPSPHHHL